MAVLEHLEPKNVFYYFEELSKIPRGTFDTARVGDYCVAFAKERKLEVIRDEAGNIIIKKPGTTGYEKSEPVILQGHLDMVCEKTAESSHDFKTDGIELCVGDGFIKAKDTTLGADNGIAVAMILALLESTDIPHPPIEALFTADEEIGMGGADAVDLSLLKGKKLLNLDSEEEGILTTGCAGGISMETLIPVQKEERCGTEVSVRISGLLGGHSGAEIHKQRGNAHKMMGRLLDRMQKKADIFLVSVSGGSKDNVIAGECRAELLVETKDSDKTKETVQEMKVIWDNEFMGEEPGLTLEVTEQENIRIAAFDRNSTDHIITYLVICPYGVQEYSRKLENLVETSVNIGAVMMQDSCVKMKTLIRSSVESRKEQMKEILDQCAKAVGGKTEIITEYPAWQYNPDSELLRVMLDTYQAVYKEEPVVFAIHAGLECGLFLGKRPDLDCVSFGPELKDVHSVNEKLDIASTERTWNYLKAILADLK